MKNPKCPFGMEQVNTCFTRAMIQHVHALHEARKRNAPPGWEPKLYSVYQEVMMYGIGAFDPATGYLKPPKKDLRFAAGTGLLEFDCDSFPENAELIRAMDQSGLMLWLCGPEMENLHVTALLETYAGRCAPEFRHHGWIDLIHPDDRDITIRNCREGFQARRFFSFVYRLRRWDGQYGLIVDSAKPRFLPGGDFAGYVGLLYAFPPGSVVVLMPNQQEARRSPVLLESSAPD
jgi:hypothetical protein